MELIICVGLLGIFFIVRRPFECKMRGYHFAQGAEVKFEDGTIIRQGICMHCGKVIHQRVKG